MRFQKKCKKKDRGISPASLERYAPSSHSNKKGFETISVVSLKREIIRQSVWVICIWQSFNPLATFLLYQISFKKSSCWVTQISKKFKKEATQTKYLLGVGFSFLKPTIFPYSSLSLLCNAFGDLNFLKTKRLTKSPAFPLSTILFSLILLFDSLIQLLP